MPGGRPTLYTPEMIQQIENIYIEALESDTVPFVEDVAIKLNINGDTVVEWAKDTENKPEFSAAYKKIKDLQKKRLQALGLINKVNPTMAIFLLKANHGFIDVSRQEHSGRDGGPIETTTLTYMPKQLEGNYFEQPDNEAS